MAKSPKDKKHPRRQVEADFEKYISGESKSPREQTISPESIRSKQVFESAEVRSPSAKTKATGTVTTSGGSSSDQPSTRNADIQSQQAPVTGSTTMGTSKHHTFNATQFAINDTASVTDATGFESYVKALARLISNPETQTPLTIGLYGDWGSGESSFMRQVQKEVMEIAGTEGQVGNVKQVWFNAWKYGTQGELWTALIGTITSRLENKRWFVRYWRRLNLAISKANKLPTLANYFFLLFLTVTSFQHQQIVTLVLYLKDTL